MNFRQSKSLNYIYYFYVVAQTGSFSKAAEQLFLTQGAISKQINILEEILDSKLFYRESRGVALTTSGSFFLEKVGPFIESLPHTFSQLHMYSDSDIVRIICTEAVAHYWLSPLVYRFNEAYPEISIHITSHNFINPDAVELFDLGILFGEGAWKNLEAISLFSEIVCPVCHVDYPIEDIATIDDLMKHKLIQLDPDQWPWMNWQDWMKVKGLVYKPAKEILKYNQATLALAACTNKQGIALGWEFMIQDLVENGILKKISAFETITGKNDFLVKAKDRKLTSSAEIFQDWLVDAQAEVGSTDGKSAQNKI